MSFQKELILNAVGPVLAALLGGLLVGLVLQRLKDRQTAEERRTEIGESMMRTAFDFYTRLIEVVRLQRYNGNFELGVLPSQYEEFRINARVLEERLRAYFEDGEARWLWHGAVDMLSLRYYLLVHPGQRLNDMIATHGSHPTDEFIPERVRCYFLTHDDLDWQDRVEFHNRVMGSFEGMLSRSINLVVHKALEPGGDPVLGQPGRGSQFRSPT